MQLLEILKNFFYKNLKSKDPVLLAYSGGVDSSCLLDAILRCREELSIDLHVVHINHGWRKESEIEAKIIKEKLKKFNIPLHYKKFKKVTQKNLENESRNMRIEYFKFLYKKYNYQALILAHQKDDLAETVLKRVLEGANLYSLTSMQDVASFNEMIVWRPLLKVCRKDILDYNESNNVEYFLDRTNDDTKYLRAKMRKDIFPYIQKNFNKEIINNLASLSSYSLEINNYLEEKTKHFFANLNENSLGLFIDLNEVKSILEIKYIIKKIAQSKNIEISRDVLNQLSSWIFEKKPNLNIKLKNANIFVDRGFFFILNEIFKAPNEKVSLSKDILNFGPWVVNIKKVNQVENNSSWKNLFKDQIFVYVPEDKYIIGYPDSNKKLKKIWENCKVPSFLRRLVPIVLKNDKIVYDFLSGRKNTLKNKNILQISLKLK